VALVGGDEPRQYWRNDDIWHGLHAALGIGTREPVMHVLVAFGSKRGAPKGWPP
jgi:hypothetical protein